MNLTGFIIISTICFLVGYRIFTETKRVPVSLPPSGGVRSNVSFPTNVKLIVSVLISCTLFACSLYIILSGKFSDDDKCWATSSISAIVAFWLKPETS